MPTTELGQSRRIPFAVWRLTLAYSLMLAGTSMVVLLAGIIGTRIAPTEGLATLPVALAVVGVASSTLPTGRLLGWFGRRRVFVAYACIAICSALLAVISLLRGSFAGFCAAGFGVGWSAAAAHQYRFAALEAVPPELAPKATSLLLLGGLLGAFIGPELAVRGRELLSVEYAGSFACLAGAYVLGMLIISFHRDHSHPQAPQAGRGRPIGAILRSPPIPLAIASAGIAYAVMSFIMTATPISMHQHAGHSLDATKIVIQSHIAAMYLPSLAYGYLFRLLGMKGMLWTGALTLVASIVVALQSTHIMNYWLALVLLGIGWNFLFLTGTNLLPYGYRPEERFRAQSTNDFLVFSIQATVALSSGWFLFHWHWQGLLLTCLPMLGLFMALLARNRTATASVS